MMQSWSILTSVIFTFCVSFNFGQSIGVDYFSKLDTELDESSGLCKVENRWLTINDSGGDAIIYEIDILRGDILRKVKVDNATNVDWEAITSDDLFIYIGDIGNNSGKRKDLCIYKILIDDFISNEKVEAEKINIGYKLQKSFHSELHQTEFDAESLVCANGQLLLITKNWKNDTSYLYQVPKSPGNYKLDNYQKLPTKGFVTDATFDSLNNKLYLCSYNGAPFLSQYYLNGNNKLNNLHVLWAAINVNDSYQVEGIHFDGHKLYITSEEMNLGSMKFQGEISVFTNTLGRYNLIHNSETTCCKFNNQAIELPLFKKYTLIKIRNQQGKVIYKERRKGSGYSKVNLIQLSYGEYQVQIKSKACKERFFFLKE